MEHRNFSEKVENFAIDLCNRMVDELSPPEAAQVAAIVAAYIAANAREETAEGRCRVVDKIEALAKILAKMDPPKVEPALDHASMFDAFKTHH